MDFEKNRLYLRMVLWLFIIHTTIVAIGLFILPSKFLSYFGLYGYQGRFFQSQAGVFHLIMGTTYLLALWYGEKQFWLIYLSIIAKGIAVVFLLLYYSLFETSWIIWLSAFTDGALGWLLFYCYNRLKSDRGADNPD